MEGESSKQSYKKDQTTVEDLESRIRKLVIDIGWSRPRRGQTTTISKLNPKFKLENESTCYICEAALFLFEFVKHPCGHRFCHKCVIQGFEAVFANPAQYPARCCQPFDLSQTIFVLSEDQLEDYLKLREKQESKRLLECFHCKKELADRSTIITESAGYCNDCQILTCTKCRKQGHKGYCIDEGIKELVATASLRQWRPCPRCRAIVEKANGCNYIACRCGAGFCYGCGHIISYDAYGTGCACRTGRTIQVADIIDTTTSTPVPAEEISYYQNNAAVKQQALAQARQALDAAILKKSQDFKTAQEIRSLRLQINDLKVSVSTPIARRKGKDKGTAESVLEACFKKAEQQLVSTSKGKKPAAKDGFKALVSKITAYTAPIPVKRVYKRARLGN